MSEPVPTSDGDGEHPAVTEIESPKPKPLAGGSNMDQLMPVLLFFVLFNVVNIIAAVIAATAWSIKAAIGRRRNGLEIGWWLPTVTIYLIARAIITILVEEEVVDFGISSEAVYFGIGFATKFLIGIALAVTILVGRPFLAWAIPKVVHLADDLVAHPRYLSTMAHATWMIVAYEVLSAVWDVWLFNNSGFNAFFLTRSAVNFVTSFIAITFGLMYIDRRLEPLESYPGLTDVLENSGRLSQ